MFSLISLQKYIQANFDQKEGHLYFQKDLYSAGVILSMVAFYISFDN
jgi:hypothetical protein